jgi:hypothetical protein
MPAQPGQLGLATGADGQRTVCGFVAEQALLFVF